MLRIPSPSMPLVIFAVVEMKNRVWERERRRQVFKVATDVGGWCRRWVGCRARSRQTRTRCWSSTLGPWITVTCSTLSRVSADCPSSLAFFPRRLIHLTRPHSTADCEL
ncbi:hypothetical protein P280DRAFT_126182 [Massarina eburnea CBS 473.64]|uniref:Uncharacterized protein n=1 Tax=Massarina eburnea CBS 473.64 TaxID=1395130 RepID=A0A6A6SED9_9PLEO|nr:hypothetical protein P280DRAFT_126182 [Massarina eburnea CBS 473.64]